MIHKYLPHCSWHWSGINGPCATYMYTSESKNQSCYMTKHTVGFWFTDFPHFGSTSFGQCIVCPLNYGFLLPFGIFKLFLYKFKLFPLPIGHLYKAWVHFLFQLAICTKPGFISSSNWPSVQSLGSFPLPIGHLCKAWVHFLFQLAICTKLGFISSSNWPSVQSLGSFPLPIGHLYKAWVHFLFQLAISTKLGFISLSSFAKMSLK